MRCTGSCDERGESEANAGVLLLTRERGANGDNCVYLLTVPRAYALIALILLWYNRSGLVCIYDGEHGDCIHARIITVNTNEGSGALRRDKSYFALTFLLWLLYRTHVDAPPGPLSLSSCEDRIRMHQR